MASIAFSIRLENTCRSSLGKACSSSTVPNCLCTVIWDFCGQELPPDLAHRLLDFCTDPRRSGELRSELGGLLHEHEVEAFFTRLERICEMGELPVLDPYRNVPRGFW